MLAAQGFDAFAQVGVGIEEVQAELATALVGGALIRSRVRLVGPPDVTDRISLMSLRLEHGVPTGEVARMLSDSYGFMVRSGHMCSQPLVTDLAGGEILRVSAYLYNEVSEIEAFYESLDELLSWIGPAAVVATRR
ncbi:aminotransferase class V-fold PLP-dependent enzyme [Streptomyces sp. 6N106]|uniref:aminotransferase class V-fold PLP-dependent enzyme n=1 Tax=Streptomyces sp. 6N106 TaxID=3457418 RepID=UPI003FD57FCD